MSRNMDILGVIFGLLMILIVIYLASEIDNLQRQLDIYKTKEIILKNLKGE